MSKGSVKQIVRITAVSSVSLLALGLVSGANAQTVSASGPETPAQASSVDDVIVTAQRRSQAIQDVPISIQAFSAETLQHQGVTSTRDLMSVVPGLNFAVKGVFAQPVLRGVSTQGTGIDSAVATYLDGVYQAAAAGGILELPDIAGIEVLKGPQGTLYGRNASGGAILVRTRRPQFTPAGEFGLSYGRFDEVEATGYVTGPLVGDTLAGSLTGAYRSRDAYIDDLIRGGKIGNLENYSYRGSLRFQPNTAVDVNLTAYKTSIDDPTVFLSVSDGGNSLSRRVNPALPVATEPFTATVGDIPYLLSETTGVTLNADIDLGWGKLTSTTGYVDFNADIQQDADSGPARALLLTASYPSRTWSQEVSVATRDFGPFSFLFGGLYFNQDLASDLIVNLGQHIYGSQQVDAYAAYGEVQWKMTNRLTAIGGLRYTTEERSYEGFIGSGPARPTNRVAVGKRDWDAVTPRLSLTYELTDDINVYATYNKAFKSGTFNPTGLSSTPVDPEHVKAIEVGAKGTFGRSTLNVAAFNYVFTDLQLASTITTPTGTASLLQNAAEAEISGVEVDGAFQATDALRFSGGLSWLDHEYTDFPNATVNTPYLTCPGVSPCGNFSSVINATGLPIARTPDFTATLTAEYVTRVMNGDLRLTANAYYNSGFSWEVANRLRQGAYSTLGANVVWQPDGSNWEFSLSGRNLTDEEYTIQSADSAGGDAVSYAQPRSFFAKIKYSF